MHGRQGIAINLDDGCSLSSDGEDKCSTNFVSPCGVTNTGGEGLLDGISANAAMTTILGLESKLRACGHRRVGLSAQSRLIVDCLMSCAGVSTLPLPIGIPSEVMVWSPLRGGLDVVNSPKSRTISTRGQRKNKQRYCCERRTGAFDASFGAKNK